MREYRETHYPPETLEICQENIDMFFNFMNERHNIWHRRFIEKLPREQWTEDPILKVTKYTNIYRELDRGTIWYLDNIASRYIATDPEYKIDFKTMLWQTIIYRLCNRIETIDETGLPDWKTYDSDKLHNSFWEKLEAIANRGLAVMTSAHLTCPTRGGLTKVEGYIEAVNDLHKKLDDVSKEIRKCNHLKRCFECLRDIHCVGPFIAYEVLCDLMYTESIRDENNVPFYEDDWANVGPGAYEGIRLLYPSSAVGRGKTSRVYARMVQLKDEQHDHFARLGIKFKFYERFTEGHLSLRSIEHSLCEFSKYWLQTNKLGKQRMIFKPDSHKLNIENGVRIMKNNIK